LLRHDARAARKAKASRAPVFKARPAPERYLKSEGRRSLRLHFSHSATFFTLPLSKRAFILTSPPQEQKNFWVELEVRLFLLAWAIVFSLPAARLCYEVIPKSQKMSRRPRQVRACRP